MNCGSVMAERTAILNVVGLTARGLGPDTPRLLAAAQQGGLVRVKPGLPAVTCTAQRDRKGVGKGKMDFPGGPRFFI